MSRVVTLSRIAHIKTKALVSALSSGSNEQLGDRERYCYSN